MIFVQNSRFSKIFFNISQIPGFSSLSLPKLSKFKVLWPPCKIVAFISNLFYREFINLYSAKLNIQKRVKIYILIKCNDIYL